MTMTHQIQEKDIQYKQELLNKARQALKEEFVGINSVIDRIIDSISVWFIFPQLQEKPLVINLWGLTGVGKTALVTRLAETIGV